MLSRLRIFYGVLGFWALVIGARLAWLQLACHEEYLKQSMHTQRIPEYVRRASILDRHGRVLAGSVPVFSLKVALDSLHSSFNREDLTAVAGILRMPVGQVEEAAHKKSGFVLLTHKAAPGQIQELRALNIKGVLLPREHERVYPYEALTEHLLGFVDFQEEGQAGLERFYNERLKGQPGEIVVLRDSLRFSYDIGQVITPPAPGTDLVLSLDIPLQYTCLKALENLEGLCHPEWATATVMDPATGEIMAHAVWPLFDPAERGQARDEHLASGFFEPGSIIKPILAAAVLREGLVRPAEMFWCGHGQITLLGRTIQDHAVYDNLNFTQTLMFSSNVGCITWGQRLSAGAFLECLAKFGFGKRTGIDLKPESPGQIPPVKRVNDLAQAYMTIGQGMAVTHAQVLQAYAALANGGYRVTPHFAMDFPAEKVGVLDPKTAATLRDILFQTVVSGTGKKAQVDGVAMAGKTGTAQKAENGAYVKGEYLSSFVGWFPLEGPRYLILVTVSEPRGVFYGSDVAAPVARDIAFYLHMEQEPHEAV